MTRPFSRAIPFAGGAALALLLTGCGTIDTSGAERVDGDTVPASDLALAAEGIVLEQGFIVDVDCGSGSVPLEVGTSIECTGVEEASGQTGGYTVTITEVVGSDYRIDVVGSDAASALESADAFAALTAQAITDSLGEEPVVDCGSDDIEIFVGQEVRCAYESSAASGFVIATVTEFDGSGYAIEVVEE